MLLEYKEVKHVTTVLSSYPLDSIATLERCTRKKQNNCIQTQTQSRCNLQNSNSHTYKKTCQSRPTYIVVNTFSPVQCIECLLTALHVTLKWFLLGMHPDMDFEAVGGEEGLATALLVADEGVLPTVGFLVRAQVASSAVGAGTALKGALVALNLRDKMLPA